MPRRKRLGIVYGTPIDMPFDDEPTDAEVTQVHAKYCAEVKRLFDTYKKRFGYAEEETLEFV